MNASSRPKWRLNWWRVRWLNRAGEITIDIGPYQSKDIAERVARERRDPDSRRFGFAYRVEAPPPIEGLD